jgi:hypothetical protein
MFLLYHSKGCNICEMVLHKCYVNDLRTTTCSGMLGHHISGEVARARELSLKMGHAIGHLGHGRGLGGFRAS